MNGLGVGGCVYSLKGDCVRVCVCARFRRGFPGQDPSKPRHTVSSEEALQQRSTGHRGMGLGHQSSREGSQEKGKGGEKEILGGRDQDRPWLLESMAGISGGWGGVVTAHAGLIRKTCHSDHCKE